MKLHKEGNTTITISVILFIILNAVSFYFLYNIYKIVPAILLLILSVLLILIIRFFRKVIREVKEDNTSILCPADGKVVAIEKVIDYEFLEGKRVQVSVFMSPLDIHINWVPVSGELQYYKHTKGKKLVAWHPKSSTDNERATTVIKTRDGKQILVRQIAGALARRIVTYPQEKGMELKQGAEIGFIKFGSRVDLLLPLESRINVKIGDVVRGNITKIADLK